VKSIQQLFVAIFVGLILIAGALNATEINHAAPVGGNISRNLKSEPPTIHPVMTADYVGNQILGYTCSTLATRDLNTGQFVPFLAEKFEISKDNKAVTFTIRKNAVFHDGKPITAEDVKFSFDAIFIPEYNAAEKWPYYDGIDIPKTEILNERTIKFHYKNTYFQNFNTLAETYIIPKHVYGDVEKSKKMNKEVICSGPYQLDKYDKGQRIVLKRFPKWAGFDSKEWKGTYNFDQLILKFVKEDAVSLEMAKKGELDTIGLTAEQFVKKTEGDPWGKTVFKHKVQNSEPRSGGFVGWNLRNELFKDKNVRIALAHLMNREEMNQKFRYGMSEYATGPNYVQSEYASKNVKPFLYDPKTAQDLLAKAGWKDTDKDGILDKVINGKKVDFKFAIMHANKDFEKYWTLYKEDLKKAGVDMEIKYLEWNSFTKMLDDGKFDAVGMAWMYSLEWDPKQIWHSSSAVVGGSNFINYKNPVVDKLIDDARMEPNKVKRMNKLRRVYETIAADAPYAFLFNDKFDFFTTSKKIQMPGETFKFDVGSDFWWAGN
jgi:microcin C transport system substrate-binding protein